VNSISSASVRICSERNLGAEAAMGGLLKMQDFRGILGINDANALLT
jgi:hypothetical protein